MNEISEERGKRPAFLGFTKSAEGASVLKHHTQQISRFTPIAVVLVIMLGMFVIANKLTTERKVPDFTTYIYLDGLKAVKPEAVSIIR